MVQSTEPIIDIYCHIYPKRFFEEMTKISPKMENLGKRLRSVTNLLNLDSRFRQMDNFGDYRQVISLPNPPIEEIADAKAGPELVRIANEGMAELCARHPDRFPAFVAAVDLTNVDASMAEARRAINDLGARGIQIFTQVAGRPLDEATFQPIFATLAELDRPIWLHPARTASVPDYSAELRSRYEMWWCFGWPYDTSVAMTRLVFAGLFDRHPQLKIVTHHCGGMIPFFDGRVGRGLEVLGSRTTDEDYSRVLSSLKRPHLEYFRMFYADTAMFGGQYGVKCALEFFGANRIVFATDTPFGPIDETLDVINQIDLDDAHRRQVLAGNAETLLNLKSG